MSKPQKSQTYDTRSTVPPLSSTSGDRDSLEETASAPTVKNSLPSAASVVARVNVVCDVGMFFASIKQESPRCNGHLGDFHIGHLSNIRIGQVTNASST